MGQFIGRGCYVYSANDKAKLRESNRIKLEAKIEKEQKEYINLTALKTILTEKNIKTYFKEPDKVVITSNGLKIKKYRIDRVLEEIDKKEIEVRLKDNFYYDLYMPNISREVLIDRVEVMTLKQQIEKELTVKKKQKREVSKL